MTLNIATLLIASGQLFALHQSLDWTLIISKIISTAAGVIINYLGNRLWVFAKSQQTRSETVCK
jgi:putative flippase GtrA